MTARAATESGARFCSGCGERLGAAARFCASCGKAVAEPVASAPRSLRDQLPGLAVLAFFLAAGLVVWVGVLQPGTPTATAPGRGGPPVAGSAGGGEMPTDHPPVGLPDEAKKFVAQLTEKAAAAPNDVATWKSLAQVQTRATEMDPSYAEPAIKSWNHVLSLAADDPDAVRGLGNVYYDQQRFDLASAQYERYLEKHGDDASVRTDLATAYLYQRQVDRAIAAYQAVTAKSPDFLQAHFNLGLAFEAKGEREKALASLDKARELAKDDETRTRIERVKTQLAATPPGAAAAGIAAAGGAAAGGMPAGSPPAGGAAAAPPPGGAAGALPSGVAPGGAAHGAGASATATGTDFPSQVEAQIRAHSILGPKVQRIEWPEPGRARVLVADFPMESMPEFARNLFKTRLDTILKDAKAKFAVSESRTIDIVDASTDATMESVTN